MEAAGSDGRDKSSSSSKPFKFSTYRNPALSAALTANSLQPSKFTFLCIFSISSASAFTFFRVIFRENAFVDDLKLKHFPPETAYLSAKAIQTVAGLVFLGTIIAFFKAISLYRGRFSDGVPIISVSKGTKDQPHLSKRQLALMGIKPKVDHMISEKAVKPPKSKPSSSPSEALVPLHPSSSTVSYSSQRYTDQSNSSGKSKMCSFITPSKSPSSASTLYLVPGVATPLPSAQSSSGLDSVVCTPWSDKRVSSVKEITSEEEFQRFLTEVDEKLTESAGKLATPPPTISSFGIASPNTVATSANTSGTARSTPLRPVRMSPSSQKFTTPPKKVEGELPSPMSMEEMIETFKHLGVYPQIDEWRDRLRQWFSSTLLNPLLQKIETSHVQVMQAAAKLGVSITVSPVGDATTSGSLPTVSTVDRTMEWQPTSTLDEDGILHQLRAMLVRSIDASTAKMPLANTHQYPQQNPSVPIMQECVDAIAEHQKLLALMKGEWVKGLLPQSSIRADYTVQRVRELSEGSCLKNYEYLGTGEVDKNKKWTFELPTDSHLLLYLFCAFLEHPKWMLHVDPTTYAAAQSSKNPLFLGVLPPKERFPEKYIAIIYGVPSVIHPGACILAVGRKSPPIFTLYLDKKLQFSLQGRTALWDSILLLCHRIKVGYGGIVRGMHLGSSALRILPVLDPEPVD